MAKGLRLSGESSRFFAQGRVDALAAHLKRKPIGSVQLVLDYGCGTGSTTPLLKRLPGVERVVGVDVSQRLLDVARAQHATDGVDFLADDQVPEGAVDVAYCNGVFHHIQPAARLDAVRIVSCALRPGGLFALCENNPWNPGTRLVMRQIPFDRDATPLSPPETRRLLREGGFEVEASEFLFFLPRPLRKLRRWEKHLAHLPLGAQYIVLARKPPTTD